MHSSLFKMLFVAIVFIASISNLKAQYVSSYNNSFTGPNLNRAKEEAYNRQMRDDQEKWRQQRYAEERKTNKYSYGTRKYDVVEKKTEVKKSTAITKPEPKKSKWDYVSTYIDGLAEATIKGKSGYVDIYEQEIVPVIYDEVYLFWEGLSAVKLNGKYGYVDTKGKVIIPLKYDRAWSFQGGKANVVLNNKQTFINKTGVELLPFKYESLYEYNDGLILAYLNNKMGFIDFTGKEIIPVKYDSVIFLVGGGKKMHLNELHYYFDKDGKPMKDVYDYVSDIDEEGEYHVSLNKKWGRLDHNSKIIIPVIYDDIRYTKNGMTGFAIKEKWGFLNSGYKVAIAAQFDSVLTDFDEKGQSVVCQNGKMYSIDKTGKKLKIITTRPNTSMEIAEEKIIESPFAALYEFAGLTQEGLTRVLKNKKWGFINTKGTFAIPLKYEDAFDFENGLAAVQLNNKWGVINTKEVIVIPFKYDNVGKFDNGIASTTLNNKYGFIKSTGKEIVTPKFEDIGWFSNGLVSVKLNGKWGYINTTGVMTITPKFEHAEAFNKKGLAVVTFKNVNYLINKTGKIVEKW